MCGRFALSAPATNLKNHFHLQKSTEIKPRYNIAPYTNILIVKGESSGNNTANVRWGLIPGWAKDEKIGYKLINARAETVHEKPSFRDAFKKRRCLIPATGFYEWQHDAHGKIPYYFYLRDQELFAMAGIWETWRSSDGKTLETCAIITTAANPVVNKIHDRMPVIIPPKHYTEWLNAEISGNTFTHLLEPCSLGKMDAHPVSAYINKAGNDGPECIRNIQQS